MTQSLFAAAALAILLVANPGFAQTYGQSQANTSTSSSSEWKPQNPEQNASTLRQLVQESRGSKKN